MVTVAESTVPAAEAPEPKPTEVASEAPAERDPGTPTASEEGRRGRPAGGDGGGTR
ncbi:hypothetical protein AB0941_17715 [Streptomyces sp. NPDC013433]|uniref:hypothetical protein n=1 Tax=Streptomyces sp. NPDC013433 TaxID=3155604 RepID=UPI003451DABE